VSHFELLHPALQHHIANSLGWRELRPFQDAVIPRILSGENLVILAPTAGGKTEAAFFPTVSRMLSEDWRGLSVLYICPIKALLNNLDLRLERYCSLMGRRSTRWHGDVKPSARKRILREPPDCLLTTPESLEVMLVSPKVDSRRLFSNVQVVIIDEIHAFAGDDRGWHLLSVLERISRIAGRDVQRIGLSATVGNPESLADWLAGSCSGRRSADVPAPTLGGTDADVRIDYVGDLENAGIVISRLHRGEKRLVFVDSRAKAELLASVLRSLDVTTFVTHSSLSQDQRLQAERAFAERDDCVIVATSVLELGVDVGDLDRVIQIDAPTTVASFLQRMGRTGRRAGMARNCLFLTTSDRALLRAAALVRLWSEGYVEPIIPPPEPYHILAQQVMALVLQEQGLGLSAILEWIGRVSCFASMNRERIQEIIQWMIHHEILWEDQGILGLGLKGEELYGRRNFQEIYSVFISPPLFTILHGRRELGFVDALTFLSKKQGPRFILLGGRTWLVNHIDWERRIAYVEPSESKGRSRWHGQIQELGYAMSQSVRRTLIDEALDDRWSRRARARMAEIRVEYRWLRDEMSTLLCGLATGVEWWTFGGFQVNATLAGELSNRTGGQVDHDDFVLTFEPHVQIEEIEQAIAELVHLDPHQMHPLIDEEAVVGLKFSECVPELLGIEMLESRLRDESGLRAILTAGFRSVSCEPA
jgi:ATP-dependent Lhr-like helicase